MTALQHHPRRSVRLDTLVRLRWLAIFGQIAALLVVTDGLDFQLPFWRCLAVVGAYAAFNLFLRLRFRGNERLAPERAAWLLAVDIAELAMLLALTGGLENPFAFLFLGPVLISATALPPRMTLMLAAFAVSCATVLVFVHYPLPWSSDDPLELPPIYMLGVWLSNLLAIGYISIYAWQITEEARQLADARGRHRTGARARATSLATRRPRCGRGARSWDPIVYNRTGQQGARTGTGRHFRACGRCAASCVSRLSAAARSLRPS